MSVSNSLNKNAASFAGLLESFTGAAKNSNEWDDTALLDDVAIISYDQALRSHRRVPPSVSPQGSESPSPVDPTINHTSLVAQRKARKSSSVTIRLTEQEEIQLHERAAAAQLSVSAYLRSCIFEAESLRAQVKEALSQIRAVADVHQESVEKPPTPREHKAFHLFPRWSHRNKQGS